MGGAWALDPSGQMKFTPGHLTVTRSRVFEGIVDDGDLAASFHLWTGVGAVIIAGMVPSGYDDT